METIKLSKQFGIHLKGAILEANEILLKHLLAGGYVKDETVKKTEKKAK